MRGALEEAFRAHAWSTARLLQGCRALTDEQLETTGESTHWSILQTLTHVVSADGYFVGSLTGGERPVPGWDDARGDPAWTMDVLAERAARLAGVWEAYLKRDDDADRLVVIDSGTFECRAGVIVAHALHHGDLHREQICAILRRLGIEPPDLQPWEYALDLGRARFLTASGPD